MDFLARFRWIAVFFISAILIFLSDWLSSRYAPIDAASPADWTWERRRAAARLGDVESMVVAGTMAQAGIGGAPENKELALSLYREAAERGSPEAAYNAALILIDRNEVREAIGLLYVAYRGGVVPARRLLGEFLLVSESSMEGMKLLRQGAQEGDGPSMLALARAYRDGKGVAPDPAMSVFWAFLARRFLNDVLDRSNAETMLSAVSHGLDMETLRSIEAKALYWMRGYKVRMEDMKATRKN